MIGRVQLAEMFSKKVLLAVKFRKGKPEKLMSEVELQDNLILQDGEKPKGYETVVLPHVRLHDAADAAIREKKKMSRSILERLVSGGFSCFGYKLETDHSQGIGIMNW